MPYPEKARAFEGAAMHGRIARHAGGGGGSKQDVYDRNPKSSMGKKFLAKKGRHFIQLGELIIWRDWRNGQNTTKYYKIHSLELTAF